MGSEATRGGDEPVTVTIEREVAPGREADFEAWAAALTDAASAFPGFLGAGLLRPARSGQRWHVVYRFDSDQHLQAWQRSSDRARLLDEAEGLMSTTAVRHFTGLETWFSLPGRSPPAPPRWKMFVVSVAGIYLLQLAFHVATDGLLATWPLVLRVAALAASVTALMTWAVMPRVARLLAGWLYPAPGNGG
ncbi:MAG TPA: antibiotic biosynthesis monooxygenase [Dermatophilaceae bacterium]|nr:antibiotic biosynthesis monooxygenase [Dermatophilaceae bacterium]